MQVERIHVFYSRSRDGETYKSQATIEVPGLGDVSIDCALSDATCEQIRKEAISALKIKLGQRVGCENG